MNYCKLNGKKPFEGNEYIPLTMKNTNSWNVAPRSLINELTLGRKLLPARAFLLDMSVNIYQNARRLATDNLFRNDRYVALISSMAFHCAATDNDFYKFGIWVFKH
jgi:hypothetical protein